MPSVDYWEEFWSDVCNMSVRQRCMLAEAIAKRGGTSVHSDVISGAKILDSTQIQQLLGSVRKKRSRHQLIATANPNNGASIARAMREELEQISAEIEAMEKKLVAAKTEVAEFRSVAGLPKDLELGKWIKCEKFIVQCRQRALEDPSLDWAGVYIGCEPGSKEVGYVGESKNVVSRLSNHNVITGDWSIQYQHCSESWERFYLECYFIWRCRPLYNGESKKANREAVALLLNE